MLCQRCGQRQATAVVVIGLPPESSAIGRMPEPDAPVRFCAECAAADLPPNHRVHLDEFAGTEETNEFMADRAARNAEISPGLVELLAAVQTAALNDPPDVSRLQDASMTLLRFLTSPHGRTHANCRAVASALAYTGGWHHLPEDWADVLIRMSGFLRDTVWRPDLASAAESTPEQLLERVRQLSSPGPAA